MEFKGRATDLERLGTVLRVVAEGKATTRGRAVVVTGRRRVGKSRLVQEFCDRSGGPYVVFQATRGRNVVAERAEFVGALAASTLTNRELISGFMASDWNQALRALALALPDDVPSVAVIDEVPWLVEQDREFEGALQTIWDRHLSAKPVLLILIGSDVSVMEALRDHGRPFFGRAAKLAVNPLHPVDVQAVTGLGAADAIDAQLITGGFPEVVQSWEPGMTRQDFLHASLTNPLSPLLMSGELTLLSEFPEAGRASAVIEAIGNGERTFSTIAAKASGDAALPSGTLSPILNTLVGKQVVAVDMPLSAKPDTKNKRYRIADPYLRFWLAFLRRGLPQIERGRGDLVASRIERSWTSWRGRAVEPLIREALGRILPDDDWDGTEAIGGWWNRQNNPEIDLVGADRAPVAGTVHFVGSIKWLDTGVFGRHEYDELARSVLAVPGATAETPLVAVSRRGVEPGLPLAAYWGPEGIVDAWR